MVVEDVGGVFPFQYIDGRACLTSVRSNHGRTSAMLCSGGCTDVADLGTIQISQESHLQLQWVDGADGGMRGASHSLLSHCNFLFLMAVSIVLR